MTGCLRLATADVVVADQAIEIEEDDGRGIERQELAQREPADDGVAERLADLRTRPSPQVTASSFARSSSP